ncbi:MAG: hypothetical protein HZC54_22980 [Verrucomicrobia bacterium]|nr:hypothetical protein [Verrucomicrobiota bacterium]
MLPPDQIRTAVAIQKKSYKLLLWLGDAIDRGLITFKKSHDDVSAAEAACEWIEEHYLNLPESARPEREFLREFSNYFGSYVTTSFDLVEKPGTKLESRCGCYCPLCAHLVNVSHLQPKKPAKRDKEKAREKRISRVMMLAEEESLPISGGIATTIATAPQFLRSAAYSAYGQSLLERVRGSEGGLYILALWREIAWKPEGSPIKGFRLEADDIFNAERELVAEIARQRQKTA